MYPTTFGVELFPPAIGLLTAVLKRSGHKVDLFDTSAWDLDNVCIEKSDERTSFFHLHPSLIPPDIDDYTPKMCATDVYQDFIKKTETFSPDLIAKSNVAQLNMPEFPSHEIEGIRRCFMLYVKMPKSKWDEIRKAEELTSAGNKKWNELKTEFIEEYL